MSVKRLPRHCHLQAYPLRGFPRPLPGMLSQNPVGGGRGALSPVSSGSRTASRSSLGSRPVPVRARRNHDAGHWPHSDYANSHVSWDSVRWTGRGRFEDAEARICSASPVRRYGSFSPMGRSALGTSRGRRRSSPTHGSGPRRIPSPLGVCRAGGGDAHGAEAGREATEMISGEGTRLVGQGHMGFIRVVASARCGRVRREALALPAFPRVRRDRTGRAWTDSGRALRLCYVVH